jgi:hypothetical protein
MSRVTVKAGNSPDGGKGKVVTLTTSFPLASSGVWIAVHTTLSPKGDEAPLDLSVYLSPREAIKLASDLLIAAREAMPFEETEIDRATRTG